MENDNYDYIQYENGNMTILRVDDGTYQVLRNGHSYSGLGPFGYGLKFFLTLKEAKNLLNKTIRTKGNYDVPTEIKFN